MERFVYAVCSNIIPRQVLSSSYTEELIIGDFFCGLNLGDFGGHFTIAQVWLQCSMLV